jgi:hypothetical protein
MLDARIAVSLFAARAINHSHYRSHYIMRIVHPELMVFEQCNRTISNAGEREYVSLSQRPRKCVGIISEVSRRGLLPANATSCFCAYGKLQTRNGTPFAWDRNDRIGASLN